MDLKALKSQFRTLAFLLLLATSNPAWAVSYTNIFIFGDSLSDTNTGASNGPLWPEYLSPQLGLPYDPSANFAVSGALSFNLTAQISAYQSAFPATDANALFVIWAGGNDINFGFSGVDAANNVINAVNTLNSLGANHFLIPNMPDLGLLPVNDSSKTPLSIDFNTTINAEYLGSPHMAVANVFELHHQIVADPAAFGFTNVTDPCSLTACSNPAEYLWWDLLHPTTAGHSVLADEFAATLATVPVPAAAWLFGSGLLGLVGIARRKQSA